MPNSGRGAKQRLLFDSPLDEFQTSKAMRRMCYISAVGYTGILHRLLKRSGSPLVVGARGSWKGPNAEQTSTFPERGKQHGSAVGTG